MALPPGTRLALRQAQGDLEQGRKVGVYDITAQIGAGGMGEVYRATDTNLKRQVAIKVLPASVAGDADRLARFQREAEVLAALNHPNIAAIYGLEKTPEFTALVMELVEGDDLSRRIARGAVPIDEALPIAKQIAEALEAAHEQGIIHRDLKPANIKVRPDGTVKVLDFGLAKAMDPAATSSPGLSMSPTITTPAMTQAGMILGTAAYMAPEQARGKFVDRRADIWAFGAVLFEMLAGRRPFDGEDTTEVLGAVVRLDPQGSLGPQHFALSPDGGSIVFAALDNYPTKLWLRQLNQAEAHPLKGTERGVKPFWSPDGRSIGFFEQQTNRLKRVDLDGGVTTLTDGVAAGARGSWNREGIILIPVPDGLARVPANGGPLEMVVKARISGNTNPVFLPGGQRFLCYLPGDKEGIYWGALNGAPLTFLTAAESSGQVVQGRLFYINQGSLFARTLDLGRMELTGEPERIADEAGAFAGRASRRRGSYDSRQSGCLDCGHHPRGYRAFRV